MRTYEDFLFHIIINDALAQECIILNVIFQEIYTREFTHSSYNLQTM